MQPLRPDATGDGGDSVVNRRPTSDATNEAAKSSAPDATMPSPVLDGSVVAATAIQVSKARQKCTFASPPAFVAASPAVVTARLTGVWLVCTTTGSPLGGDWFGRDDRSYAFTAGAEWYALGMDDHGELVFGSVNGADAGPAPLSGTFTFQDSNGDPVPDGGTVGYLAADTESWFQPYFSSNDQYMWMAAVDGLQQGYARVK